METLKLFEDSVEIKRVTIDKACDVTETVSLSFENDKLSFDSVIDENTSVEPTAEESPKEPEQPKKSKETKKSGPKLEIDNATRDKILKWLQEVYRANYSSTICSIASQIWDHIHAMDITYEELDNEINSLYKRVRDVTYRM